MYERRTFVLLRAVTVYVYLLSQAFDCQMKQPSVVFSFCQGSIWIRRNKMRLINQGLKDLLAYQPHPQDLHRLGSSAVHFYFAQDIL